MVTMAEVVKHDHYDHHHHGRGQIHHDHHLEEKDAKHVHNGGGHGRQVPLPLLVYVLLVHQIFNLLVSIKI